MSFSSIKSENASRFTEVQVYLNYITSVEPLAPDLFVPIEVKIMRGLFYVHLYAAIEKSVNELVQITIMLINSKRVQNNHYTLVFNTISKMDKIKAINDCGSQNTLNKSIELFNHIGSRNISDINETIFSNKLQNIWIRNVEEIILVFGINNLHIEPRERATIDEVVDKRNAVAHGRESATYVGERHRVEVLRDKLDISQNFIAKLIDAFEYFYENKNYLKPAVKKKY